jgi:hypothetical protein
MDPDRSTPLGDLGFSSKSNALIGRCARGRGAARFARDALLANFMIAED